MGGRLGEVGDVERTDHRQDRTAQLGEPLGGRRQESDGPTVHVPGLEFRTIHRPDRLGEPSRVPVGGLTEPVRPHPHVELDHRVDVDRVGALEPIHLVEGGDLVGGGLALEPTDPGADRDHRDDPVGELDRRVEGDLATAAVAHEDRPPDPEGIEHRDDVRPVAELDVVGRRPAEPPKVVPMAP